MADHVAISSADWLSRHLTTGEIAQLRRLVEALADNGGACLVAVVGSVARERRTPSSDLDVVVVAENPTIKGDVLEGGLSVFFDFSDVFVDRLEEGEPIAFAALRDARPVYDTGLLRELRSIVSERQLRPSAEKAIQLAAKALNAATQSLGGGLATFRADLKRSARAVGMAVLLARGFDPASGPELEEQLRSSDETELAAAVAATRASDTELEGERTLERLRARLERLNEIWPNADRDPARRAP